MGYRESVLVPHGYEVIYQMRQKYPGSDVPAICIAIKNSAKFFPFRQTSLTGNYARIKSVQHLIPHMATIADQVDDVFVLAEAPGTLIWAMETSFDISLIEQQLTEFATATQKNGLIHGDLRPWNVFFDNAHGIRVIDWSRSCFVDELHKRPDLLNGHLTNMHGKRTEKEYASVDLEDARRIVQLLRGEIKFNEAWSNTMPWHPAWCRH